MGGEEGSDNCDLFNASAANSGRNTQNGRAPHGTIDAKSRQDAYSVLTTAALATVARRALVLLAIARAAAEAAVGAASQSSDGAAAAVAARRKRSSTEVVESRRMQRSVTKVRQNFGAHTLLPADCLLSYCCCCCDGSSRQTHTSTSGHFTVDTSISAATRWRGSFVKLSPHNFALLESST